jgi:asparagine synthase (glutamine-hydrolysing)
MCGFAGFIDPGRKAGSAVEVAGAMADVLAHRGPDSRGVWTDGDAGVALGHRRLSIIDLSPEGHQPMVSACGRYAIAYNGEIYNFRELRRELDRLGAVPCWRGHSDTEVLLAAIAQWGVRPALRRVNGMFAFALWDRARRMLYLARDRIGEKPLYYGWVNGAFLFGSELKALRRHPRWEGQINREALALLLRFNCIPAPHSIYRGVSKLAPGMVLEVPGEGYAEPSRAKTTPYWTAEAAVKESLAEPFRGAEVAAIEALEERLREAVALRMQADVPLGAFLSGGVDSATVVALMQAQSDRPVQTFTIGFDVPAYDEAEHARTVAHHLGTDHTELYVSSAEARDVIPQLADVYDEPFSDSSQIPSVLIARLARRSVKVALSGDGGDELFAGYNRHFIGRSLWRRGGWTPTLVRRSLARGIGALSPSQWDTLLRGLTPFLPRRLRQEHPGDKLQKLAAVLAAPSPQAMYAGLVSHWSGPADVVSGASEPPTPATACDADPAFEDATLRMMYLDLITYLPNDILTKMDRASMAVGLETRMPLLDPELVQFAWSIPLEMKIRDGQGKWLLRQVLYRHVPSELIERPKKGFAVPIDSWLRGPLRDWAEHLLSERRLRDEGFFDPAPIREKWREHVSMRRNWQHHLWDVLMFQAWLSNEKANSSGASPRPSGDGARASRQHVV